MRLHKTKFISIARRPGVSSIACLATRSKLIVGSKHQLARYFSNEDFRKTLNKIQDEHNKKRSEEANVDKNNTTDSSKKGGHLPNGPSFFYLNRIKDLGLSAYDSVVENVKLAYKEMMGQEQPSHLTKKVTQADSYRYQASKVDLDEDEDVPKQPADAGPSAIVLVKEPKGAWEAMKERLQDSPLIREILKNSRKVGQAAANTDIGKKAQDIGRSVQDKIEDAREIWDTSQNPIIYTLSGVWDSLTGETEEGTATAAIRKLDPTFNKEDWAAEVRKNLAPMIIRAHLVGDTKTLKPWLGEGVYNKLAADIRTRKHDGIVFDTNILDIDENQIIMRFLENGNPVIVVVYMVQQINCIRNRKGEIIEGGETEIRAKFYSMAFQQSFDEDESEVHWKIVDYEFAGDIPYY